MNRAAGARFTDGSRRIHGAPPPADYDAGRQIDVPTDMTEPRVIFDRRHVGHRFPTFSAVVETGRLRFFAQATGQTDTQYTDAEAARAAGHASLPAPPTFVYCLENEGAAFEPLFRLLGADNRRLLHAEQGFRYFGTVCAGDTLTFKQWVDDIYEKKDGLLQFVVRKTTVTNARHELVAELRNVLVLANEPGAP